MSKTPKGQASKKKILDAAEQVFKEKGFLAAKVGEVIKAVGISSGALYHHFPTKKSLLQGIAERSSQRLAERMEEWVENDSMSPCEKVGRFLDEVGDRRRLRLTVDRLQIGLAREDRDHHELVVQLSLDKLSAHLTTFIEQGNTTGEFKVIHPKATSITLILLLSEFMHRAGRIEKLVTRNEFDETVRQSVAQILGIT